MARIGSTFLQPERCVIVYVYVCIWSFSLACELVCTRWLTARSHFHACSQKPGCNLAG
jgi:hypothetical protein